MYLILADAVLVAHFAFIVFVLAGGLLLLRWRRLLWLHLPAVIWAVVAEAAGWICPLTPLENYLRARGGGNIYQGDFVAQYLIPLIYPAALTPAIQMVLAAVVLVANAIIYALIFRLRKKSGAAGPE